MTYGSVLFSNEIYWLCAICGGAEEAIEEPMSPVCGTCYRIAVAEALGVWR